MGGFPGIGFSEKTDRISNFQMEISMVTKRRLIIFSFVVCVLVVAALGVSKSMQERPFKISGDIRLTIDITTCSAAGVCYALREDWGEATHLGRYTSVATGVMVNVITGYVGGSGVMTAANGDQLFWDKNGDSLTITGGTGRFDNASGEFDTSHPPATVTYPNPYTAVVTHPFQGSGTITY